MDEPDLSSDDYHSTDERFASYFLRAPELDPDEVSRLTEMAPDTAWHVGDLKPRAGIPYTFGNWSIDSGLTSTDEFHEHLDALLIRLKPSWPVFVDLGRRYHAVVGIALYLRHAQGPWVELRPSVAAALAELNATLDFDLYALPEDKVAES